MQVRLGLNGKSKSPIALKNYRARKTPLISSQATGFELSKVWSKQYRDLILG